MPNKTETLKQEWANRFQPLVGRTIKRVHWLDAEEVEACGFDESCIVLTLDDDTLLFPSRDDEGNGAGALYTQVGSKTDGLPMIAPVI